MFVSVTQTFLNPLKRWNGLQMYACTSSGRDRSLRYRNFSKKSFHVNRVWLSNLRLIFDWVYKCITYRFTWQKQLNTWQHGQDFQWKKTGIFLNNLNSISSIFNCLNLSLCNVVHWRGDQGVTVPLISNSCFQFNEWCKQGLRHGLTVSFLPVPWPCTWKCLCKHVSCIYYLQTRLLISNHWRRTRVIYLWINIIYSWQLAASLATSSILKSQKE